MKKTSSHHIKTLILPCLSFSIATGILSALIVTLFKQASAQIINVSGRVYGAVAQSLQWLPCLLLGAAAIGFISSLILSISQSCRGGGIPTSIAAIQGIINLNWVKSVFLLPISAMLSFLCGIPLGTEGPCVQMGTAVGDGVVRVFGGKKNKGWRRYIMTGGASAGFSVVTGAPITSIIFSMEELHKRFTPLLFSIASISVISSQITLKVLSYFGIVSEGLFYISGLSAMPAQLFYIPLAVGVICGACSIFFSKAYHKIDKLVRVKLARVSVKIKLPVIFACVALVGFFIFEITGSGHSLVESIFERHTVWYMLIVIFLIRLIFVMSANTAGVTGGIFLPTLAFGAIVGALCAEAFVFAGVIDSNYYVLVVVLGMISFLGSVSRIPLTAGVFAVEALSGINNILPIIISVTVAFLIAEFSGVEDFTDTVVESKARAIHEGKTPRVIEVPLTVCENSFVVGKELRDILWPVSCLVISVERDPSNKDRIFITAGDIITVRYKTYAPLVTAEEFEVLVGDQPEDIDRIMRPKECV